MATAGRAFDEPRYIAAAEKARNFLNEKMVTPTGRLLHRYRDGDSAIRGFAGDYAFYIWGLIELFQATQNAEFLDQALKLNDVFFSDFWDENNGGFFTVGKEGENLLIRDKEVYDGAMPSANSVAMYNLIRLARITGNAELEEKASRIGAAFSQSVNRSPSAHTFLMTALTFAAGPAYEIVIVGEQDSDSTEAMLKAINEKYIPNSVIVLRALGSSQQIDRLSTFVRNYESVNGKATAYVCQNFSCRLPTNNPKEMLIMLEPAD